MPRTVDHIVEMHRLAADRRPEGKPVWAFTVEGVKDALGAFDDHGDFLRSRDEVVAAIKASAWYRQAGEFDDLWEVVDEMSDVGSPDIDWDDDYDEEQHFNACMDRIYDLADWDRAWIS